MCPMTKTKLNKIKPKKPLPTTPPKQPILITAIA